MKIVFFVCLLASCICNPTLKKDFYENLQKFKSCFSKVGCSLTPQNIELDYQTFNQVRPQLIAQLETLKSMNKFISGDENPKEKIQSSLSTQEIVQILNKDHSKSIRFYGQDDYNRNQENNLGQSNLGAEAQQNGIESDYGNCLYTVRYKRETEIKSILLDGSKIIEVTTLGMGNKYIINIFASAHSLLLIQKIGNNIFVIYKFKVNQSTCEISNTNITTFSKCSLLLGVKMVQKDLFLTFRESILANQTSNTYKYQNGLSQIIPPNRTYTFFMQALSDTYDVLKLRCEQNTTVLSSIKMTLAGFGLLADQSDQKSSSVFMQMIYYRSHPYTNCYSNLDSDFYTLKITFLNDRIILMSKSAIHGYFMQPSFLHIDKGGNTITSVYNKLFFSQATYLDIMNITNLQTIHTTQLSGNIVPSSNGDLVIFYRDIFNTTSLEFKMIDYNGYGYIFQIDNSRILSISRNKIYLYENVEGKKQSSLDYYYRLVSTFAISKIEGFVDFQSLLYDSSTKSIVFGYQNQNNPYGYGQRIPIPSILSLGFVYLYYENGCFTMVPRSSCDISAIPSTLGPVNKHWNVTEGNFYQSAPQRVKRFKIMKRNNSDYLYSISKSQVQSRKIEKQLRNRVLKNPPEEFSKLNL